MPEAVKQEQTTTAAGVQDPLNIPGSGATKRIPPPSGVVLADGGMNTSAANKTVRMPPMEIQGNPPVDKTGRASPINAKDTSTVDKTVRMPELDLQGTPGYRQIMAEEATNIIEAQLQKWWVGTRFGAQNAALSVQEDAFPWFAVALAGNLIWAATVFVPPASAVAIAAMSIGGALLGSGSLEQYDKLILDDPPPSESFRDIAVNRLGLYYQSIMNRRTNLATSLMDLFYMNSLTDRDDVEQAEKRRQLAWAFMFKSEIGYNNPVDIENTTKNYIEAVWTEFVPRWQAINRVHSMRSQLPELTVRSFNDAVDLVNLKTKWWNKRNRSYP